MDRQANVGQPDAAREPHGECDRERERGDDLDRRGGPPQRHGAAHWSVAAAPSVLREHAFIGDGDRGALVGPHGQVGWLCVPRWDDEPVFAESMGGYGTYDVAPADPWHVWGGSYHPGTLVWRSRWVTSTSIIECDEALAYPADPDVVVVLRRIRAVAGEASVTIRLRVGSGFAEPRQQHAAETDGTWQGRSDDVEFRWHGGGAARVAPDGTLEASVHLVEGHEHSLVLELARGRLPMSPPDTRGVWDATFEGWRRTVPDLDGLPLAGEIRQSYAVLAGLTSSAHGMVAAATMSLPERAEQRRDYDYRYAWIRDQCYAGTAVARLGDVPLLESALTFVTDRVLADEEKLRPAYRVDGGPVPNEHHVGLGGYPGGGDTAGNWVNRQFQLDACGEALTMYAAAARRERLDARRWEAVRTCARVIADRWQAPDAGVWELDDAQWTHSRLACVAGLRAIAPHSSASESAAWTRLADDILSSITATSLDADGAWLQRPDRPGTDAALLLPGVRGALPPDDARTVATLAAVDRTLSCDGHVYRFRHHGQALGEAEGSFTLCGLVTAMALAQNGQNARAVHFFERARSACTSSGLFTEEYDVTQHQLRGNLPQAFVHALFIEAAVLIGPLLERAPQEKP